MFFFFFFLTVLRFSKLKQFDIHYKLEFLVPFKSSTILSFKNATRDGIYYV